MSDERTEQPTPQKLREARKKGQVAKSKDAVTAIGFVGFLLFFVMRANHILMSMSYTVKKNLSMFTTLEFTPQSMPSILVAMGLPLLITMLPLMLVMAVSGVVGNLVQTGWLTSSEAMKPKFNHINPVDGFKKIFSAKGFVEFIKITLKTLIIVTVFKNFFQDNLDNIFQVFYMPLSSQINAFLKISGSLLTQLVYVFIVIGVLDYFYQLYDFNKQMKMTKQEVKDEYKNTEGDPTIKQKIKAIQREMVQKRMMNGVKDSRVVITNPTHFAVSLKYDEMKDPAPIISAKGQGYIAQQIKELARKHNIPIIENPPVARELYKNGKVGRMIPVEMFQSVAEIIAFVERLNHREEEFLRRYNNQSGR